MNKVILIGNLSKEIELRYSQNGSAYAKTTIALNERTQNGENNSVFVDCTLFGKTAELANQYLQKGSKVCFEGKLNMDKWQDQQSGANRTKLSVIVEKMEFIGTSPQSSQQQNANNGGYQQPQRQNTQPPKQAPQNYAEPSEYDKNDNIPF